LEKVILEVPRRQFRSYWSRTQWNAEKKVEDEELEQLLNKNPCQTQQEFA